MSWKIYHNPRCSKSRETLELLKQNRIDPEVIEYLNHPLSAGEIQHMIDGLGDSAMLVRTKEAEFKESPFDTSDADTVKSRLLKTPKLLERPVVIFNQKVVLGRPPENVLTLLKDS